jgi:hypothetical protein
VEQPTSGNAGSGYRVSFSKADEAIAWSCTLNASPSKKMRGQVPYSGTLCFIKTVEDLYEAMAGSVPGVKFGIAFAEASGPC